jgi:hypothetical protein
LRPEYYEHGGTILAYLRVELIERAGNQVLVYLSFLICAVSGGSCHVTIPEDRGFAGVAACQMEGMVLTPQWQEQHPGWTVKRIRCSIGNRPHDEEAA